MRHLFPAKNIHASHDVMCLHEDAQFAATSQKSERGATDIGKVNLILIGLLVVILLGLLSKEESNSSFSHQTVRAQTQVDVQTAPMPPVALAATVVDHDEIKQETTEASMPEAVTPAVTATEAKPARKKAKAKVTAEQVLEGRSPVVEHSTSPVQPVVEELAPKNPPTKIIVFNIWSVSELRLRSAYASFMNDSDVPAPQLESRKKDYLNFVSRRTRKCGELDNKFASNINSVEKLNFGKGDVEILECHAAENNVELDKLSAHGI